MAVLLLAAAFAFVVGIMGVLFSEGVERCPRCGHWSFVLGPTIHPDGCPETLFEHAEHAVHVAQTAFRRVHLRHP